MDEEKKVCISKEEYDILKSVVERYEQSEMPPETVEQSEEETPVVIPTPIAVEEPEDEE